MLVNTVDLYNIKAGSLYTLLRTDPQFTMRYIVALNGNAVADKLQVLGFNRPQTQEQVLACLNVLLERGNYDKFTQALSVPFIGGNLSFPVQAATLDINRQWQDGGGYKFNVGETPVSTDDVLSGLAVGILTMLGLGSQAQPSTTNLTDTPPANTTTGTAGGGGGGDTKKPLIHWSEIGLILGGLAIVVGLVVIIRKAMRG